MPGGEAEQASTLSPFNCARSLNAHSVVCVLSSGKAGDNAIYFSLLLEKSQSPNMTVICVVQKDSRA